ncbi:carbohydrate kinase family protein [Parabacteroides distasonis]|jgi:sugar/nucleoside kinase (ribokinase family)|uniref:Sugar kinase n=1 Tax=Parabacteroides distasonis TaxID=823 RepID=A0A174V4C7_PARDI|nr:carbohydrate kinase family protein [Parabacteroides distasonis]MRY83181.1 sugar kinase [Parabacteroides distasonis]MRZ05119.1 sugar kinase [Parabacteroides distasonis]CUQ29574.1 Uncharacterized sugar kinase ydjH [Parabacteroides distasonis]
MRTGIIAAGTWLADLIKFIPYYPAPGNLVSIEKEEVGLGGCAHNVLMDLAKLQSGLPLYAAGCIGKDAYGDLILKTVMEQRINAKYLCQLSSVPTSYTDVMVAKAGTTRTFFHNRGANAEFGIEYIDQIDVPAKIFHLGYLLLLDKLEEPDKFYQLKAARVFHELQQKGYETSVDVVSEESDRFRNVLLPCLPYINYLVINEVEAGSCYGVSLRGDNGEILLDQVRLVAVDLMKAGVNTLCCIHFPEGGYALHRSGEEGFCPSYKIQSNEIVSTVGAGDAFCAGVLYAAHEGLGLKDTLRFANALAHFNLLHATCCGGAPRLKEVYDFIKVNKI